MTDSHDKKRKGRRKNLSDLPKDHPLRNLGYVIGGTRLRSSQTTKSAGPTTTHTKESDDADRITLADLVSPTGLLIDEYHKRFGHPVPGYAARFMDDLDQRLNEALETNTPIGEFEDHVIDDDVSDETFVPMPPYANDPDSGLVVRSEQEQDRTIVRSGFWGMLRSAKEDVGPIWPFFYAILFMPTMFWIIETVGAEFLCWSGWLRDVARSDYTLAILVSVILASAAMITIPPCRKYYEDKVNPSILRTYFASFAHSIIVTFILLFLFAIPYRIFLTPLLNPPCSP